MLEDGSFEESIHNLAQVVMPGLDMDVESTSQVHIEFYISNSRY